MNKLLLAGVSSMTMIASGAYAQTPTPSPSIGASASDGGAQVPNTSGQLGDIVVTAQRRAQNLQDVPIAITAVSSQQLKASGIVSTAQLGTVVSGFSVGTTSGYFSPRVRGIGTSFFGPAVENPVALYVDDVYFNSQLSAPADLFEIEQVSVLKGPQGTLFGRNATGGVIQMTTRQPKDQLGGEVATEVDQYLTSRNYFYLTGPVTDTIKTNLFLRYTTQGEGWGKNLFTNDQVGKINHDYFIRSKWEWNPTSGTNVRLGGDYEKRSDTNGQNLRFPFDPPPGYSFLFPGLSTTVPTTDKHDIYTNFTTVNRTQTGGANLRVEQDLGFGRLVSITGYRRVKFSQDSDTDASAVTLFNTEVAQRSNQFSQELQLGSKAGSPIQWLVGGFYYKANDRVRLGLDFYDASAFALNPAAAPLANFIFLGGNSNLLRYNNKLTTESLAGFGQATATLWDNTRLTGGIRYTRDRRTIEGDLVAYIDTLDSQPIPFDQGKQSFKQGRFTWRASVDHDFAPHVLGYASYNRGYKSGGYNAFDDATRDPYLAEKVDSYEVGMKTELFDRKLRLNPAVFYSKYSNIQVAVVGSNLTTLSANAPGLELYGIDIDGQLQATRTLNFTFGIEVLKTRFTEFENAPINVPIVGGGSTTTVGSVKGNRLPFAAKFTGNIGVNYTADIAGARVDFNVTDAHTSAYFFEVDNQARQKAFDMLNFSVTWHAPDERLTVGIFGRNMLDELVANQIAAATPYGFGASYNTPPRTYGIQLRYLFGRK